MYGLFLVKYGYKWEIGFQIYATVVNMLIVHCPVIFKI